MSSLRTIAAAAALAGSVAAAHADVTIPALQGAGATSPLVGQFVTTSGVVTVLTNNGFFLQDPDGDGNPATSDGVFVFTSSAPTVSVGQWIRLSGTVAEYDVSGSTSNPAAEAQPLTELTGISGLTVLGTGSVSPVPVTLPVATADGLERYEGMLVTLAGPLTVQQNYFQGRYGQLTVAAGGRRETPTNRHRPGTPEALALASLNARSALLLDDASSRQNPNPTPYLQADGVARAGDTLASLTGAIDFGLATSSSAGIVAYRLQPSTAPVFAATNPRPADPPAVGGNLRVASFNVLNYFTTFTDGSDAFGHVGQVCTQGGSTPSAGLCRGANNATEFQRQRTKIVKAIVALDADVVGLMEIQNNGDVALDDLVAGLNAEAGAPTWAAVPGPVEGGGAGDDAIRVAMIYKPAALARVGAATADADPVHNRPPLAQTFEAPNGERLTVIVNHFKSKGCTDASGADADLGDGQGCWNATRTQQAHALRAFAAQRQAAAGAEAVLVIGDLNAYGQEDPVHDLVAAGWVDQLARFAGDGIAYSYVFDGQSGRLDHAIASAALSARVAGAATWAINADEASLRDYNQEFKAPRTNCGGPCPADPYAPDVYRASDHDPVCIGLDWFRTVAGDARRNVLTGGPGADLLIGGPGADRLTGGPGGDRVAYASMRDAGDVVTDFEPGIDQIDLRALLAPTGYAGDDAVADGFVRFRAVVGGTRVQVDLDGAAGGGAFRDLLTLRGVAPAQLDGRRDLLVH